MLLGFWLEEYDDVEFVGAGHTRDECLAGIRREAPDVVLLDSMSHSATPLTVDDVRAAAPGAAVVVYSGYSAESAAQVVVGEPDAFLVKGTDAGTLVATVRELRDAPRPPRG